MCKSSKKKLKKHNLLDLVVLVLLLFCLVDCSEERGGFFSLSLYFDWFTFICCEKGLFDHE